MVSRWADDQPDAPALISSDGVTVTYARLNREMTALRDWIFACGYGRGDRIGIVHPGGIDLAIRILGVMKGFTAVPLNPAFTESEFRAHLKARRVKALIVDDEAVDDAIAAAQSLGLPLLNTAEMAKAVGTANQPNAGKRAAAATPPLPLSDDIAYVVQTSGSTAQGKIVPITHGQLLARMRDAESSYGLTPANRCLNLNPLFSGNRLYWLVFSVTSGGSAIFLTRFSVETFFHALGSLGPTWYTGSHTFHHQILQAADNFKPQIKGSTLEFVRTSSGGIAGDVAEALQKALGVPVTESYGASECGIIAANPRPPGRNKRGTVGPKACGEVAVMTEIGRPLPPGERGEVMVRGPNVFSGYENAPELNAEAFVDGWFRTGDEGFFDEDGYLTLTGRIKEVINRGGEKVSPAEVDAALMAHPDVSDAACFPIPHPTLGEEVAAAVVQAPGARLTDQVLSAYLLRGLSGFKVPRRFYFVDEIPKSDAGKVQRFQLAEALGLDTEMAGPQSSGDSREATPLEARLQGLWARALGLPHVGLDDNFFLLGGDSLQAVDMFLGIERDLGRRLPRSVLFSAGTVAEMARLIEDEGASNCLVPIQTQGAGVPFFCVHDGNGDVLNLRDLAKHMGTARPFYGIQCRGLDGREMPFLDIAEMAAHYVAEITRLRPEGPYYIGGYSFGGRVAYVMAQQLRATGAEVVLAILDSTLWTGRRRDWSWKDWLARHRKRLKTTSASELPAYIAMRFENLGTELRRALLTGLYGRAVAHYRAKGKPYPRWLHRPIEANDLIRRRSRLASYGGDAVLFLTEAEPGRSNEERIACWRTVIEGRLDVVPISGQHYQIVRQPHVQDLAAKLAATLESANEMTGG